MTFEDFITELIQKRAVLEYAGFKAKSVIINSSHASILIAATTRTSHVGVDPTKVIGLPVIVNDNVKEIQIGV